MTVIGTGIFFAIGVSVATQALEVGPLVHELRSNGSDSSTTVVVRNAENSAVPIEVTMSELIFSEDGNIMREEPADEEFLVFPPTSIVPAGGAQAIRIQWLGSPDLTTSKTFFAGVNQVPVELEGDGAAVQVLVAFKALVHVVPEGSTAELDPVASELSQADDGESVLTLQVLNRGNRYVYTSSNTIDIRGKTGRLRLGPDEIRSQQLDRLVTPGVTREIVVPLGSGDWSGPISVQIVPN